MTIVMEMGLIHPPVGLNIFVIKNIAPDIPLRDVVWGVLPFVGLMFVAIVLICVRDRLSRSRHGTAEVGAGAARRGGDAALHNCVRRYFRAKRGNIPSAKNAGGREETRDRICPRWAIRT